jgi:heme oxygenase (biliverdin-IX-beta and delta-forming)
MRTETGTNVTSLPSGLAEPSVTVRDRLRASTAALHARVDRAFSILLQHAGDGYGGFLSASAAAVLPLEQSLHEGHIEAVLPDWEHRSRATALMSDLDALGVPVPQLRSFTDASHRHHEAYQFGILYVLEGSRLGARSLLREREKLGIRGPTRYLSHGQGLPLWQTFVARLEASRPASENFEMTLAGAIAAFELFLPQRPSRPDKS